MTFDYSCDIMFSSELKEVIYKMIKRESYLSQIRPFIDKSELIKVIVGVRRSGKSIMLELIKEELLEKNVSQERMIFINFEDMNYSRLTTAAHYTII